MFLRIINMYLYLFLWRCFSFRSFFRCMLGIFRCVVEGGVFRFFMELLVLLLLFFIVDFILMFMLIFIRLVFVLEFLFFLARLFRGVKLFFFDSRLVDFFILFGGFCFLFGYFEFFRIGLGEGLEFILLLLFLNLFRVGNDFLMGVFILGL